MEDTGIGALILAALPGIGSVLWLAFKSWAAKTETKWDDEVVRIVEASFQVEKKKGK